MCSRKRKRVAIDGLLAYFHVVEDISYGTKLSIRGVSRKRRETMTRIIKAWKAARFVELRLIPRALYSIESSVSRLLSKTHGLINSFEKRRMVTSSMRGLVNADR